MAVELDVALRRMGAPRVEAAIVACLVKRQQAATQDIVQLTGLRQPEVSVGMQQLRKRGWIDVESVPREGKGRPMHKYSLAVSKKAVGAHYVARAKDELTRIEEAVKLVNKALS